MIERIVVFLGCNINPLRSVHRHFGDFVAVVCSKEKEFKCGELPMSKKFFCSLGGEGEKKSDSLEFMSIAIHDGSNYWLDLVMKAY